MNIEVNELDELLNYLETTSLEPHDNYTSEFTYKDQKILYKYIKDLQQERDKYKSIIDKLKKYLKEESKKDDTYFIPYLASIHKTLDKIKELEEGEENV